MIQGQRRHVVDEPELAAGFAVWLCSGRAAWPTGRYLSANWGVDGLTARRAEILRDDLLVNRVRAGL